MTHKDQLNRHILLSETPKRIVSLVPSQTELLVDMGLEEAIVGVTKFCVHPKKLRASKTVVGGTKQIKLEKIKELNPDIILCNKEENSKTIIDQLESVSPIHISDIYTIEDCCELIEMYGCLFKVEAKAYDIIHQIQTRRQAFKSKVAITKPIKVAYFIWKNPWMVAGSNTFIGHMIHEAGFENVFQYDKRYPEISLDHPKLKAADAIFLSSEPYPFKDKHVMELQDQFPDKTIKVVDGEMFSWYGSRSIKSYSYFSSLFCE